jgi:hypothetical protein
MNLTLCAASISFLVGANAAPGHTPVESAIDVSHIVNGEKVGSCGWPTAVDVGGGCTGTLVHAKAITTAQHCSPGPGTKINFGDRRGQKSATTIKSCYTSGSDDSAICELNDEVTGVPVTPILFGCEVENYMKVDQPVIITGYGALMSGGGGNSDKYWANQKITKVEPGRVIIGTPGDGVSPCNGDSGGPVFVKVSDGSYRVFGTVWKGTSSTPCNSGADFQRPDVLVAGFENSTGLDITPCFDGQTGAWDPSAECTGFFAGSESNPGSWDNLCEGTPASGASMECGDSEDTDTEDTSSESSETGDESSTEEGSSSEEQSDEETPSESSESEEESNTSSDEESDQESSESSSSQETDTQNSGDPDASETGDDDDDDGDEDESEDESDEADEDGAETSSCACTSASSKYGFELTGLGLALGLGLRARRRRRA